MTIAIGQTIMASDISQLQMRIADLEAKLRNVEASSVLKKDLIDNITPDYTKGVDIISQSPYHVKQKGIIRVKAGSKDGVTCTCSINNSEVFWFRQNSRYAQPNMHFHVKVGDVVSWELCDIVMFYPYCKQ